MSPIYNADFNPLYYKLKPRVATYFSVGGYKLIVFAVLAFFIFFTQYHRHILPTIFEGIPECFRDVIFSSSKQPLLLIYYTFDMNINMRLV